MKIDVATPDPGLRLGDMKMGEVYELIGAARRDCFYLAVGDSSCWPTQLVNLGTGILLNTVAEDARFLPVPKAKLVIDRSQQ